MSRIGKKPIHIPEGISLAVEGGIVSVKGPKGALDVVVPPDFTITKDDDTVSVAEAGVSRGRDSGAMHGTARMLVANAIEGVSRGFSKVLELEGIGYRANLEGKDLVLNLGYSHPVRVPAPEGIIFAVEKNAITVSGIDKQLVGNVAASIRALRKPEPYKGKGIRYRGEVVRRKAGKKAAGAK